VNLNTGAFTTSLRLPNATGSFKEFGVIPVMANGVLDGGFRPQLTYRPVTIREPDAGLGIRSEAANDVRDARTYR
jgi:hypothetical protein